MNQTIDFLEFAHQLPLAVICELLGLPNEDRVRPGSAVRRVSHLYVLIGNSGGQLRSGRYIDYPGVGKPGNRVINALYCTLDQAAGSMRGEFNLDDELRKIEPGGPLEELLG